MTYQPNATPEPLASDDSLVVDLRQKLRAGTLTPDDAHALETAIGVLRTRSALSFEKWLDECDAPAFPDLPRRKRFSRRVLEDFRTGWDGGRQATLAEAGELEGAFESDHHKALAAIEKWVEFIPAIRGMGPEHAIDVLAGMVAGVLTPESLTSEDRERELFEQAAHAHYLTERGKRQIKDDFEVAATRENLMWRQPNGEYGVLIYNAAWWAWKARAARIPTSHAARRFTVVTPRGEENEDQFRERLKGFITPARPQHYDDLTGMNCAVCKEQQFSSPGGITCPNGHGGADSL
jgi:hypothetical protein